MHRVTLFRNIAVNVILIAAIGILCLGTLVGTLSVTAANVSPAVYEGDRSGNNISLMINVYWGDEYLDKMLDVLSKAEVKTTFFVGGSWAAKNPDTLKRMLSLGNEIGNHGYLHKDSDKLSEKRLKDEIVMCHRVVEGLCSAKMRWFAPPSGAFDNRTLKVAEESGYRTVMWTRDTIDWRDKDDDIVYRRAVKNLRAGDLILMHPTAHTLAALPKIIAAVKEKGLVVNTVSATVGDEA